MLAIKNIFKNYNDLDVLANLSIDFIPNKINVILGKSGCGKTTLLKLLSKNILPTSGTIKNEFTKTSYVFQNDNLIPWKTVQQNIEFVLKHLSAQERKKQLDFTLKIINLEEYKHFYPKELSGGMNKRVDLGRALAYTPDLLIMDEPFSSLDSNTTQKIVSDLVKVQSATSKTIILVTHNIDLAIALGDIFFLLTDKPTQLKATLKKIDFIKNDHENSSIGEEQLKNTILSTLFGV